MQIYPLRCTNRHTPLYSQAKSHIKSAGTCMLKVILYTKFLYVGCITEAHDGIAMSFVTSNYNTLGKSNTKPTYTPKYFHFNMFCLFVCFFKTDQEFPQFHHLYFYYVIIQLVLCPSLFLSYISKCTAMKQSDHYFMHNLLFQRQSEGGG